MPDSPVLEPNLITRCLILGHEVQGVDGGCARHWAACGGWVGAGLQVVQRSCSWVVQAACALGCRGAKWTSCPGLGNSTAHALKKFNPAAVFVVSRATNQSA